MRLDVADLHEALRVTGVAIESRPTVPLLSMVGIEESSDGQATFSATDWNTWVTKTVDATGEGDLSVLVPHRTLAAIAKVVTGPVAELTSNGSLLTVTSGRSTWTAPLFGEDDLPRSPATPGEFATVDATEFAHAVHAIAGAAGRDDTVPELTALRLETEGDRLTLAATDRYRYHGVSIPYKNTGDSVLAWPIAAVVDQLASGLSGDLALLFDGQVFGMRSESLQLFTRTLEGKIPSLEKFAANVTLSGGSTVLRLADLTAAVKSVTFALEKNDPAVLTVDENEMRIVASGQDGSAAAAVEDYQHVGDPVRVGINPKFLLDAASSIRTQSITLHWNVKSERPYIVDSDASDIRAVVMPVRLPR